MVASRPSEQECRAELGVQVSASRKQRGVTLLLAGLLPDPFREKDWQIAMTPVRWTSIVLLVVLAKLAPGTTSAADLIRTDLPARCQSMQFKDFQGVSDAPTEITSSVAIE